MDKYVQKFLLGHPASTNALTHIFCESFYKGKPTACGLGKESCMFEPVTTASNSVSETIGARVLYTAREFSSVPLTMELSH